MRKWRLFLPAGALLIALVFIVRQGTLPAQPVRQIAGVSWQQARPPMALQNGDLVFRHARGVISGMLRYFSRRDSRYSHAGIIAVEPGGVFVYHALGGEGSSGPGIRRERLETFCSEDAVHAFGIYRYPLTAKQAGIAVASAREAWEKHRVFDTDYNLSTDSALYCTEFVYKCLVQATGNQDCIPLTTVNGWTYVACDDLYFHSAKPVYIYTYEE